MDQAKFEEELAGLVDNPAQLIEFLDADSVESIDDDAAEGIKNLAQQAKDNGIGNVRFVPSVARGFDYYTDIVFEVFDLHPENNRSMFGGGRYDGLVGSFGVESVPTIGIAPGDVTMQNFLESHSLLPELKTEIDVYIIVNSGKETEATQKAAELREDGKNVAVDYSGRKTDKQFKTAIKRGFTKDQIITV